MSLYKRKDSSVWWVKLHHSGKIIQRSTGTTDKVKAQEYHDRLKASLWEQERLGTRPRYSWQQAAGRWLEETAHKATHGQDVAKLKWLHMWVNAAQSKNRKPIAVPLNREALAVLHRQLGKHPARVFTFAGQPIANANTRAWRNALKRAGIENFRWHDLRHTWASWHRMQGTPTHELQQLGGWKTSAMVERYAHLAPDHLANAAARLDSVLDGYDLATPANK